VIVTWQRRLAESGGAKGGKPLAGNTIRLARAPLAGAFKLAVEWVSSPSRRWQRYVVRDHPGPCPGTGQESYAAVAHDDRAVEKKRRGGGSLA
jgi:hypothetical protein